MSDHSGRSPAVGELQRSTVRNHPRLAALLSLVAGYKLLHQQPGRRQRWQPSGGAKSRAFITPPAN
jgi:hypothetical protein